MLDLFGLLTELPYPVAFAIFMAGCWLSTWGLIEIARKISPKLFPHVNLKTNRRISGVILWIGALGVVVTLIVVGWSYVLCVLGVWGLFSFLSDAVASGVARGIRQSKV